MLLRLLFLLASLALTGTTTAQDFRFDLRTGTGVYHTGALDMRGLMVENELNYTLNRKFTISAQFALGRSNTGVGATSNFLQTNGTLFWSPFGNDGRHDFRLGAGVGYASIADAYTSRTEFLNNQIVDEDYTFRDRRESGANLVIEHTYALTPRLLLGGKAFVQTYANAGLLLKLGVRL